MKKRVLSLFLASVLCLTLLPTAAFAEGEDVSISGGVIGGGETGGEGGGVLVPPGGSTGEGGGIYVAPGSPTEGGGGTYIPGEDTRTEIWCTMKPSLIQRSYDGTTDGGKISIDLGFTDGTNTFDLKEGTGFTAKKTFDSADAGRHTVTVEIELIGDAAAKYKLKAGEETFTIGGYIDKAYPDLTVTLSKTACTAGEKILPLLSVSGVQENAAVTYYYAPVNSGYLESEGTEAVPAIDENTAISDPGTYYVYAKTAETTNYEEERSETVELTVTEPVVEAASITKADGTDGGTYESLPAALNAAQDGDTVTLLSDVDLGETSVTISKSITFDLNGKTLSSSGAWLRYGVLLVKDATVTVKNGTVKAAGDDSCAIQAYRSGASMTLEDVTATVTSGKSSVTVGDFGSAVIKSGDYQGLYVGAKSQVTLEGGTFRPYMDTITNENVKSIFWKVNETTDATSRDCMELLGDGCVYVDENRTQVRTGGGFNTVVTVQQGTAIDAPVAKIGDVKYASLSKAINAVQNGGTITLLDDLDLGNGAVLQVGSSQKNFTIDLDNHTLSADGACLIMLHNGSQLTLKNGTLDGSRCTSYNGVLYISSNSGPKLTLENVTAKSGSVADFLNGQRSVSLAYVACGTVVFDGGTYTGGVLLETDGNAVLKSGTFQKGTNDYSIKTEDSGKHLSDYLDDDSQFWDDNTPLDLSSETQTADEVTVRPCEHNWENGKCTVCQKVCDHGSADGKSMTSDPCQTCGMKAAAQVDITGSDAKYFPSFNDALVYAFKNDGCTLKLLADVTGTAVMINNPFIFDLNGHNVDALSVDAKATIKDSGTTKGRIGKVTVFDTKVPGLTLGGLLEEGYAFKYGNGYWANDSYLQTTEGSFVTVEKAPIQSVNVYAKDKNNQEILTIAYGATGEVTLVSSCRMGETSGADLTYLWYKLEGAAATAPLEGATGANYTLPDNLAAGTHTYLLICTSDGYSKSKEITITVTPISLEGATVTVSNLTYNGNPQEPTVTVKLSDETLSRDNDYTVQVTKQTDAGSYKLTIKGGGNYSGEIKDVEWKIEPMKIDSVMVSSDISKTYDGTATVTKTAEEWAKVLTFKTLSASGVVDVPSKTYTISDAYFVKKSGEETIYSPDAGEKYGITFKITLNDDNYVLQTYGEDTPSTSKVITQSGGATFTIKQATVTSPGEITQLVFNDLAKTYTIDLATLLPELSEGCAYGSIQYQGHNYNFTDNAYLDGNDAVSVSKEGVLTLSTVAASTAKVGDQIGTITVPVMTTNYQKFEFTIKVYISERIPPNASGVTVSASDITYGQMLNESKLTATGTMKHPGTGEEVKGTFAWTNPEAKPGAAGDYTASWTFTPAAGYEEYAPATGTVTVKVKPAKLTVSVKASRAYYTGEAQIASIIASGQSVDSTPVTFTYSDKVDGNYTSGVPTFTDAGTYTAYYKAEAANHEPATGTFTVTIDPLPISLLSVSSISKTYDGSADVTLTADKLTFFSKTAKATNIKLPDTALTFSDAQFTSKQEDGSYLPSPEVGNGKALSFTMTLTSNNYVFEGKSEGTTKVSDVFATDDVNRFTITKAAAPTDIQTGTLNIINGTCQTYTYDFNNILPGLSEGKYGTISYGQADISLVSQSEYNYGASTAVSDRGVLTLAQFSAEDGKMTGRIGTVKVTVTTTNYENFQLKLVLNAVDQIKPEPDGTIIASEITYGQTLSESRISGTMKDPDTGKSVNGTFAWTDGTINPNAGGYEAEWTFTPAAGYEKYATATGTVTIKVNKAAPTFTAPTAQENLTYTGQEQALITAGSVMDYGTMQYSLTENGTYSQDIPVGTDAGTYTVWYRVIGDANHNDTAPASVAVSIGKKPLTITGVTAASKPYDGTTNADISSVTFDNVTLNRGTDYTVTANFDDASVDSGKNITATVTLMEQAAKNYALEQSSFPTTGSIIKAAAPDFTKETALTIVNGHEKTYTVTLPALPTLETPKEYGALTYEIGEIKLNDGYYNSGAKVENGELTLPIQKNDVETTGSVGTVTVVIKSANYEDITLTVNVSAKNRITPTGTPTLSKNAIIYGDALNTIALSGKLHDNVNNVDVDGTFEWVDGTHIPVVGNGTYAAEWIFEPTDTEKYLTVSGRSNITVEKAQQYGKVSMAGYTYGQAPSTPTLTDRTGDSNAPVTYKYSVANGSPVQTWDIQNPPALNAGTYRMYASIGDTDNYYGFEAVYCEFVVAKATPTYTAPTGLTAKYGQMLADVTLPDGWSWMDSRESVGGASTAAKKFMAKFTPKDTENYNTVENIELEVTVNKADGGNLKTVELEQKYTDASDHTYAPNWAGLPAGQDWTFSSEASIVLSKQDFAADGSLLTYAISGGKAGDKITITLKASCDNYEDFTITLNVTLTEKDDQKPLTITGADSVVYGQTLTLTTTGGSGTGAVTCRIDKTISTGEATIDPETGVLTPVKVGSVSVIATKAGDNDYNDVTSAPFVLMIKPATPTGEPNYTKITTSGKTLKDAALTTKGSTLNPSDGKLEWVDDKGEPLPDDTTVKANTTYKWRFTPDDDNYTTLTGEVELYYKSSSGGSGYSSYTIKAVAGAGGSISPTGNVSVREGADQTFTITPDKGYTVSNVKIDGNSIGAVKSYTFENVSKAHTIEVIFVKDSSPQTGVFVDVAAGSYYEDAVDWAAENGIAKGTSHTTFSPDAACTRAQAVTFLWRAAGSPEPETRTMPFTDVSADSYYYDAVLWAVENGIAKGTSHTTFSPDATCTRAQAVTFLWRSEKSPAGDTDNPFTDVKSTDYYADAVLWAVREEITKGTGNTTFSPNANCTRAQIVTFLWRCKK